jgi:hypothetical protein
VTAIVLTPLRYRAIECTIERYFGAHLLELAELDESLIRNKLTVLVKLLGT